MAVTLTTSWQNIAHSTWEPGTGFSVTFWLDAKYSTQNVGNNTTTIQTRLTSYVNRGHGEGYNYSFSCSYAPTVSGSGLWTIENEIITTGESTINHNADGSKTLNLSASAIISGIDMYLSMNADVILPKINRASTITSFTGSDIKGNFKATYTATSSSLKNKLKILLPNNTAIQTFDNYVSGTNVTLNSSAITAIKNYTSAKTITLGGVIETWSGSTKVGESSELTTTCTIKKPAKIRINGEWKDAVPYVRVNGQWKEVTPYIRVNGVWKEEN